MCDVCESDEVHTTPHWVDTFTREGRSMVLCKVCAIEQGFYKEKIPPNIIIETPKFSWKKYDLQEDGSFKLCYLSPVFIPFNYGCIPDKLAEDGMPADVVVVGPRRPQGTRLNLEIIGEVACNDNGEKDTKYIATLDGKRHERTIHAFFKIYEKAKFFIGLLTGKGFTKASYQGITWYEGGSQ